MRTERAVAVLGYLTLLGWFIAYFLHRREGSRIGAFHLRQSLGVHLLGGLLFPVRLFFLQVPFGAPARALVDLCWVALLLASIQGILHAYRERERPLPLIGEFIQEYFRSLV